jgi:Na+/H+ antiporter NhaD/arsenite permease-like protein
VTLPVPAEFLIFGLTLLGVALSHERALEIAAAGLAAIVAWKLGVAGFDEGPGVHGLLAHLTREWSVLANLAALLLGFALLSRHFEDSHLPRRLPNLLPDDWRGGFVLLVLVFLLSAFLDNIAAALIGGTVARDVFRERVHTGYVAALVAASNAGGSGSVIGDTTTTMMWIDGVQPHELLRAYVAAVLALVVCGIPAAMAQQRYSPIELRDTEHLPLDWSRVAIVVLMLAAAVAANVVGNLRFARYMHQLPLIGLAIWLVLLATAAWRRPDWRALPGALRGAAFLLCLVTAASLMPVDRLPAASWPSALGLGFLSAVFDNIPLTKLALEQGGYDWGLLAFAVGFGGSMIWFGSSAGVAITSLYPEARSAGAWLRSGWPVVLAYPIGFAALLLTLGWRPG